MERMLVIDLEMCKIPGKVRKKGDRFLFTEIIQIGAVILDENNCISDEFGTLVRPQMGEIDEEIAALTGITTEQVKDAPILVNALSQMSQWLAGRSCHVLSWSETDYFQLKNEMRSKRIHNHMIEKFFDRWSDLQKSFSEMIGLEYILSLERVLTATDLAVEGKLHDGLDDARNTARILQQIQAHPEYELEYTLIEEPKEEVEHLNSSLGNFFSADILKQFAISDSPEDEETQEDVAKRDIYQEYRRLLFGTDRETGDCWPLFAYQQRMRYRK